MLSKHKFKGLPSKGFVFARVRKYIGQRATFRLTGGCFHEALCEQGFDEKQPIIANGIFRDLFKVDGKFQFVFQGLSFYQGDKQASLDRPGWRRPGAIRLWSNEIDLPVAKEMNRMYKGLLVGGINKSDGS